MATVTRQPFAPLDGARLQSLTSMKNRQNGAKRKAADLADMDDSENVDPVGFSKRCKASNSPFGSKNPLKPSSFVLTNASSPVPSVKESSILSSPTMPVASPRRTVLQPKSPAAKLNTSISKSSPLSAPAGRSPTRGKRSGLLSSRRRTAGPYSRVDPPAFNVSSAAPFSLDAALKGTIPSYASRSSNSAMPSASGLASGKLAKSLREPEIKSSWYFDIHEDTPEQEMTNLLQHSTCVLDISSDEESEKKATRERAEGRDKENIPPVDDVSQTAGRRSARRADENEMVVEKERIAMGELDVSAFYADGCDESSVIIVPADEEEEEAAAEKQAEAGGNAEPAAFDFAPQLKLDAETPAEALAPAPAPAPTVGDSGQTVDELMGKSDQPASKAAVLEPIEGTGESFELWESGSFKDDNELAPAAAPASPAAAATEAAS